MTERTPFSARSGGEDETNTVRIYSDALNYTYKVYKVTFPSLRHVLLLRRPFDDVTYRELGMQESETRQSTLG